MKRGQILGILALLLVCAITVIPAMAANVSVTTPTAHDAATDYYNDAEYALAAGNYTNAIALYDQALGSNTTMIKLSNALFSTYQDKSYAQMQMGNYTGAIATLNAGLVVYPNDENFLNNKGYAQYNLGNYADAVTSYDQALASDANFTPALINKGDALEKMGNYQDAVTAYKAALASDPNNPDNTSAITKLAAAEKAAASAPPVTLIVLAVVVVIVAAGVAYYVTRKTPVGGKTGEESDKKAGKTKK
ncbi:tetratricopeptide repeat protein [Methanoregula sp.]|uniref:tetratricopeptide repeat protein n=1 Tax=Methanoregula sp. TaxID=2052170 RepID=UPI003BAEBBD8